MLNRIILVLVTWRFMVESSYGQECGPYMEYVVSGPKGVPDDNITASTSHPNDEWYAHDAKYGRLYHYNQSKPVSGSWTSEDFGTSQYLQVAFAKPMIVCAVLTQGRPSLDQWIPTFAVLHSLDGATWQNVKNAENNLIFNGNSDRSTMVRNNFSECVAANYMRVNPITWEWCISLRMDFLGCSKRRKYFYMLKNKENVMFWKEPAAYDDSLKQVGANLTPELVLCAIACHQMSRCVAYTFNSNDHKCVLFAGENSQISNHAASGSHFYSKPITQETDYFVNGEYSFNGGKWAFDTNVEVPVNLWAQSFPVINNGLCIIVSEAGLETKDCTSQLYFVCEMSI